MSRLRRLVLFAVVIALAIARFLLTANDSPDTLVIPPQASGSAIERAPAPGRADAGPRPFHRALAHFDAAESDARRNTSPAR